MNIAESGDGRPVFEGDCGTTMSKIVGEYATPRQLEEMAPWEARGLVDTLIRSRAIAELNQPTGLVVSVSTNPIP